MDRHIKRLKNKIKETAAFTLAEALVATLILLLVTSVVVAGIPAAINAYDNVVVASNAEMLMSTAMGELRNELSTAREVEVKDNVITFYNESTGFTSRIYVQEDSSNSNIRDIMYERYAAGSNNDEDLIDPKGPEDAEREEARKLVSEAASDRDTSGRHLHVEYGGVTYSNGVVEFTDIRVTRKDGRATRATRGRYLIRVISK